MNTYFVDARSSSVARILIIVLLALVSTSCTYMKMNPPADADKAFLAGNNSCYLATAANMLAGAGYGTGTTVQDRADDIYGDLTTQFGTANGGWTDTALTWWLGSANNTWATNPYSVVTVYGNKNPKNPWANSDGAQFIGNELRRCHFVGVSISWPTNAAGVVGSGGHAITGWGDRSGNLTSDYSDLISINPARIRVADSDTDTGGDVQQYVYDAYTNPNPGGANEGNGWYFDYDANHPYIKHIITLAPTETASGAANMQRVLGSYRIYQGRRISATDLHYDVETDVDILSYVTWLDRETEVAPEIEEYDPNRTGLTVDWDLSDDPIEQGSWVTINTEFILRTWNAISYDNVHFTYPELDRTDFAPAVSWEMQSVRVGEAASIPNVTGGYVIASFDIIDPELPVESRLVGQYRLVHQYSYTQSPERHSFILKGAEGYQVENLSFGHSYGMVEPEGLWSFSDWMTKQEGETYELSEAGVTVDIDWTGLLPYPEGEDVTKRIRDIKTGLTTRPLQLTDGDQD